MNMIYEDIEDEGQEENKNKKQSLGKVVQNLTEDVVKSVGEEPAILEKGDIISEIEKWREETIVNFDAREWIKEGLANLRGYTESVRKTHNDIIRFAKRTKEIEKHPDYKKLADRLGTISPPFKELLNSYELIIINFSDYVQRLLILSKINTVFRDKLSEEIENARDLRNKFNELKSSYFELKDKYNKLERKSEEEKRELSSEKEKLENDLNELRDELNKKEGEELEDLKEQLNRKEEKIEGLLVKLREKENEVERLKDKLEMKEKEIETSNVLKNYSQRTEGGENDKRKTEEPKELVGKEETKKLEGMEMEKKKTEEENKSAEVKDTVVSFVSNKLFVSKRDYIPKEDIYNAYQNYCESRNINLGDKEEFFGELKKILPIVNYIDINEDAKTPCFKGIKFKETIS